MSKSLLCLLGALLLVQMSAARYYKPLPLVCSVTQDIQIQVEEMEAKVFDVVRVPVSINKMQLNTIFSTSVIPVTAVDVQSVTAQPVGLEVTEIKVQEVTEPITLVKVNTLTSRIVHTDVDVLTSTATNYHTDFHTLTATDVFPLTVTNVETVISHLTETVDGTLFTTLTLTQGQLQTTVKVVDVPSTSVVGTATVIQVNTVTNTHSLTKMITQAICPPFNAI